MLVDVTKDDLCWVGKFGSAQRSSVRNKRCLKEVDAQPGIAPGTQSWPLNPSWALGSPWGHQDFSSMCWDLGGTLGGCLGPIYRGRFRLPHSSLVCPCFRVLPTETAWVWHSLLMGILFSPWRALFSPISFQCASTCPDYPLGIINGGERVVFKTALVQLFKKYSFFPFYPHLSHLFLCWLQGERSRANSISQAWYYVW